MHKYSKSLARLILVATLLLPGITYAQLSVSNSTNLSTMDVNDLSDKQLQTLLEQASSQGLTVDQAITIAKSRGASQSQIDALMLRISTTKKSEAEKSKTDRSATAKAFSNSLYDYADQYSQKADVQLSARLKRIFGNQLFNNKNLTFEPSANIPIPKNYVLGVNDELKISISGASQQTYTLKVDNSGMISIPYVGPIMVMGMEYEDARKVIQKRLSSLFRGMSGPNPNTWAETSVSGIRSIKVHVVGDVLAPGTYTLPATASAFNALYLSGGPNENGSFRNIQVKRDGKTIKIVDVYDYLLNSETNSNIALRDQDILFIPTYENRVCVDGAFKRPGFYELKKDETLEKLMQYTGGLTSDAYKGSLSVYRIKGMQRNMVDVKPADYASFVPTSGDSIFVGNVLDRYENRVYIAGAVFRPGTYALTEGMKVSDLIKNAEGLREDAFTNRGVIMRKSANLTPSSLSFVVGDVFNSGKDIPLQREDSVIIQDIFNLREKRTVEIFGEVQKPGVFDYNENMTILDLIFLSGGLKEAASESFIEISRRRDYQQAATESENMVQLFQLQVSRDLKLTDQDKRFILSPYDNVYIRKAPSYYEQKTVTIEGEVQYPGPYSIQSKNERISDLIKRCGGLTKYAYINGATLYRLPEKDALKDTTILSDLGVDTLATKASKQLFNGRVQLKLDKIMKNPKSSFNYHLKEGDRIIIPEVSEEVRVAGAILNPVGLAFETRKNAGYYIEKAGGFNEKANPSRVYVIYSDGTTKVTKTFFGKHYPMVLPGSKIIVPEKIEKPQTNISQWLAIASTFSSLAVAIAAVLK